MNTEGTIALRLIEDFNRYSHNGVWGGMDLDRFLNTIVLDHGTINLDPVIYLWWRFVRDEGWGETVIEIMNRHGLVDEYDFLSEILDFNTNFLVDTVARPYDDVNDLEKFMLQNGISYGQRMFSRVFITDHEEINFKNELIFVEKVRWLDIPLTLFDESPVTIGITVT